jgi:hypothetical protein
VTGPDRAQTRVDPSPTQASPLDSPVPTPGRATPPRPGTPASSAARATTAAQAADERERQRRDEKLRRSEERLRKLISDICTGCTGTR